MGRLVDDLPTDLAAAIARAGVDVCLDGRALQDAVKTAIGERRGYLGDWRVDGAGWWCRDRPSSW